MIWTSIYIASIVLVNWGFAHMPGYELFWSFMVGTIFITRDLAQRHIGKWWILAAMGFAGIISYYMATPFVVLASVSAFAISELTDWLIFTFTKRPFHDRILLSSTVSTPLDSAVFLGMIGILGPGLFAAQVSTKMLSALLVYGGLRYARAA